MYGGSQMTQASPHQQFAGYPQQGAYAPGPGQHDPRASVAASTFYDPHSPKPSHYDNSVSPTGSPPPMANTPPLAAGVHGQQQYQAYNPAQAGQYAHYNNQQYGHVAELPASRPDGELRELA